MERSARRGSSSQVRQRTLPAHQTSPISCVEIPHAILPSSSFSCGLIVAEDLGLRVKTATSASAAPSAAVSPSPLRVLLLPPASTFLRGTLLSTPEDVTRRLREQPGAEKRSGPKTARAAAAEWTFAQTLTVRLARQARLAQELLAVGQKITGVWMHVGADTRSCQECVNCLLQLQRQQGKHSLLSSLSNAIVGARSSSSPVCCLPEKDTENLCCCFLFFPTSCLKGGAQDVRQVGPKIQGYCCAGSSAACTTVHRLPVHLRCREHPRPDVTLMRVVYSTFIPLQLEIHFIPTKTLTNSLQRYGPQLSSAFSSLLYVNFFAVLSPPVLASPAYLQPPRPTQPTSGAAFIAVQQGCNKGGALEEQRYSGFVSFSYQLGHVYSSCHLPTKVAKRLRGHFGPLASKCEKPIEFLSSTILSSLSAPAWNHDWGDQNYRSAFPSSIPFCFLQPLLVEELMIRYEISLVTPPEPSTGCRGSRDHTSAIRVCDMFQISPCGDVSKPATYNSRVFCEPTVCAAALPCLSCPAVLSVKGEFVAAVLAPVNISLEHLQVCLAADAATAVARRVVERLTDACALYYAIKKPQREQEPRNRLSKEQHSAARRLPSLEVRRFYTLGIGKTSPRREEQHEEDTAPSLLLSDFSDSEETESAAAKATVERFEVLLGGPPAGVFHSFLKDGEASVFLNLNSTSSEAVMVQTQVRKHSQSGSSSRDPLRNYVRTVCRPLSARPDVFWNCLAKRIRSETDDCLKAYRERTSLCGRRNLIKLMPWRFLVLIGVLVAMHVVLSFYLH